MSHREAVPGSVVPRSPVERTSVRSVFQTTLIALGVVFLAASTAWAHIGVTNSNVALTPGKHTVGMEFTRGEKAGPNGESLGQAKLYIDEKVVAEGPLKTQPGKFTLSGDGLCVGYDSGDAVSQEYKTPGKFTGGTIAFVGVTVEKATYADLEKEAARALARD